jgi:polygalacturonase
MSSRSAAIRFGHLYSKIRNILVKDIKILPSNRGISIFSGDDGIVENVKVENVQCETRIHAGGWWGKGEGFIVCAANAGGKIKDVTIENCHFIEENPSIVAGTDGLIIEVHNNPQKALCDGAQSLTPAQFDELASKIAGVKAVAYR